MTQTQPDPYAGMTLQQKLDAISNAFKNGGLILAPATQPIGISKGEQPVGLQNVPGIVEKGGTNQSSANRAAEFGVPLTQYGTISTSAPYMPGDETQPGGADGQTILQLQSKLMQAGLLKAADVRPYGIWDDKSQAAYKVVLAFANQHGMNANDALNVFLSTAPANNGKSLPAPGQVTNTLTAEAAVRGGGPHQTNYARDLLGRDLSPAEAQQFAAQYQAQEAAARQAYISADLKGQPTSQAAPDIGAAADAYIKQNHLADSVAYGTASRMFDFFNMLKGPV